MIYNATIAIMLRSPLGLVHQFCLSLSQSVRTSYRPSYGVASTAVVRTPNYACY